jgi:pimeloyl-ACP methyl ester carboxylesterase
LRFSIEGKSPNDLRGGTLAPLLNKSGTSNSLSSTNVVYPNLTKTNESLIVAVYTPPDFINEPNASYKPVTLLINNPKNPSAAPSPVSQITIRLYHPPVILVHGLWENPSLWNILSNFLQTLNQSKLNSTLADYRIHNATTFDPYFNKTFGNYGINATRNAIGRALKDYHGNATAASQVDVVAHSMGGLIARGFVQ